MTYSWLCQHLWKGVVVMWCGDVGSPGPRRAGDVLLKHKHKQDPDNTKHQNQQLWRPGHQQIE